MSQRFCVATPVGQWPVWQRWAWMQPMASIASRATATVSQPSAKANITCSGKPSLPAPLNTTFWCSPRSAKAAVHLQADLEGLRDVVGEDQRPRARPPLAAVDLVTKSTPRPVVSISRARSSQNFICPRPT
jgi:hypothetical protein